MSDQLEFDLVLIEDAGRDPDAARLLDEAAELLRQSKHKVALAQIAQDLRRVDLVNFTAPANELAEMQALIGARHWKKTRRHWQRRLKQNVKAFRKVLIVLRHLYDANDKEKTEQTETEL